MKHTLASLQPMLAPYFQEVLRTDQPVMNLEGRPVFPDRGRMDLHFNLSPLKDVDQTTQGVGCGDGRSDREETPGSATTIV